MSKLRFRVVETAFKKKPVAVAVPAERPSEYFAKYVFNKEKMFRYLPSKVYAKLIDVIDNGAPLDRSIADEVAAGMKKWALEMGSHPLHALVCIRSPKALPKNTTLLWNTTARAA